MDVQIKKGLLDFCVLYALSERDRYGYELTADLQEMIEISETTLYAVLNRLTLNGYLFPYSNVESGKLRKYYKITDCGIKKLNALKQDFLCVQRLLNEIGVNPQTDI